jgi:hypothetical protein
MFAGEQPKASHLTICNDASLHRHTRMGQQGKKIGYLKRDDGQYFAVIEPESISFGMGEAIAFDIVRGCGVRKQRT